MQSGRGRRRATCSVECGRKADAARHRKRRADVTEALAEADEPDEPDATPDVDLCGTCNRRSECEDRDLGVAICRDWVEA